MTEIPFQEKRERKSAERELRRCAENRVKKRKKQVETEIQERNTT